MLPFKISFKPGLSVYRQAVYAAKKSVVSGQLQAGDKFPSVRSLSQGLKINPNTAHKVVAELTREGLLQVHPGLGTVVAAAPRSSRAQRTALLEDDLEQLVVEAKRLSIKRDDLVEALGRHWSRLSPIEEPARRAVKERG